MGESMMRRLLFVTCLLAIPLGVMAVFPPPQLRATQSVQHEAKVDSTNMVAIPLPGKPPITLYSLNSWGGYGRN